MNSTLSLSESFIETKHGYPLLSLQADDQLSDEVIGGLPSNYQPLPLQTDDQLSDELIAMPPSCYQPPSLKIYHEPPGQLMIDPPIEYQPLSPENSDQPSDPPFADPLSDMMATERSDIHKRVEETYSGVPKHLKEWIEREMRDRK